MSSPHVYQERLRLAAAGGVWAVRAIAVLSCRLPTRPPGTAEFRVLASPTPTVAPAETSTPTVTLGPPTFTTRVNANCRSGPGLVYDVVRVVMAGTSEPIVGRDAASTWWVIQGGARCWISNVTGTASGDLSGVPVIPAPPTPAPTAISTPTITPTATPRIFLPHPTIFIPPVPQVSSASITVSSTTCIYPCTLTFSGTITATGPLTANYEWQGKFGSGPWSTLAVPLEPLVFSGSGTLNVPDFSKAISSGLPGTRTYRLHVTSPNSVYSNEVEVVFR